MRYRIPACLFTYINGFHAFILMLHYILALWMWIPESVYPTQMFPLSHSGQAVPASVHAQYQSRAKCLLFFFYLLFLLIITRPQSADHHSFIPHILTWGSRVFVAVSCCLQELLLHKCQIVKFNITCYFSPTVFFMFFTSNLAKL